MGDGVEGIAAGGEHAAVHDHSVAFPQGGVAGAAHALLVVDGVAAQGGGAIAVDAHQLHVVAVRPHGQGPTRGKDPLDQGGAGLEPNPPGAFHLSHHVYVDGFRGEVGGGQLEHLIGGGCGRPADHDRVAIKEEGVLALVALLQEGHQVELGFPQLAAVAGEPALEAHIAEVGIEGDAAGFLNGRHHGGQARHRGSLPFHGGAFPAGAEHVDARVFHLPHDRHLHGPGLGHPQVEIGLAQVAAVEAGEPAIGLVQGEAIEHHRADHGQAGASIVEQFKGAAQVGVGGGEKGDLQPVARAEDVGVEVGTVVCRYCCCRARHRGARLHCLGRLEGSADLAGEKERGEQRRQPGNSHRCCGDGLAGLDSIGLWRGFGFQWIGATCGSCRPVENPSKD